jgi:hypothetical protein
MSIYHDPVTVHPFAVAIDGVSSTVPWFVVTVNVCAPAAVPKEVYKASKAAPSSLMPCTEKAYFIPVIIIEVTFVKAVENGPDVGTDVTPEQLTFIFFMALTDESEYANDVPPGDDGVLLVTKRELMLVIAELDSVKLVKLMVFEAKLVKFEPVTDEVLNDGIDSKEKQFENMPNIAVTEAVLNKGTDFKDTQLENMLAILVTESVLNKGTDFKDAQLKNMADILVTDEVLNKGTDFKDLQPENMADILVTDEVLNKGTDSKDAQSENMLDIVVTEVVLNKGTDCKEEHSENMVDIIVTEAVLNKGTDFKEPQVESMLVIFVTDEVLNKGTDSK